MKRLRILVAQEAERHLLSIWQHIAEHGGEAAADRFVEAVRERCRGLDTFAERGTPRDDLRAGLRTVPIPRRATIGYTVDEDSVVIVAVAYRGQDLARLVREADGA